MKAVIMAGGFGTRLRPLTSKVPKPMMTLMNIPMMEHIVNLLKQHGITDILSTLFFQPEAITGHFGDGSRHGIKMQYRKPDSDVGTAGSVKAAKDFLDERFIVISGDVLTDFDLTRAVRFHQEKKAKATLLLTHHQFPLQFGVVLTRDDGKITRFLEKPSWGEVFSDAINTGIYIFEPEILELIPRNEEFDFSKNLFPMMLEQDMGLYGYVAEGYWRDIGNLHEYQDAHLDIFRGDVNIHIPGVKNGNIYIGEGSDVETLPGNISGMVVVGKKTKIHRDVILSNSVIGDDCVIMPGTSIKNSVIWDGTIIGAKSIISTDVIGRKCTIGEEVILSDNVFMSDNCIINKRAQIYANVKLWPGKVVEEGAIVTRSLVWEDRWLRELFTNARVSGISNIEINPEFGAKLGAAYGAFLGAGSAVVASRDVDNTSRMISRSIMCGLMSAGVNCSDLRHSSIPVVRHELRSGMERGGFHVRKSPYDKDCTDIVFFDTDGKDIPMGKTKTIERLFFGEDFPRAPYENVGSIAFPERTTESYMTRFLSIINVKKIRDANFKLVIDYSNGVASAISPNLLGNLNVSVIALNAYLDKAKLTRTAEDVNKSMNELSYVVTALKSDIGCMLDPGAEKLFVVDENGCVLSSERLLTLMTKLVVLANPTIKTIAVPVSASGELDILAKEFGLRVVRTRDSHLALMDAVSNSKIKFAGGARGSFIFSDFLFATDGIFSIAKLLEMMAITGTKIGALDRDTRHLHIVRKTLDCPWNVKGKVMRLLMKDTERFSRELIDGVKVFYPKEGEYTSVFMSPDRSRPLFFVTAESEDHDHAAHLAVSYEQKLSDWIKNNKE